MNEPCLCPSSTGLILTLTGRAVHYWERGTKRFTAGRMVCVELAGWKGGPGPHGLHDMVLVILPRSCFPGSDGGM